MLFLKKYIKMKNPVAAFLFLPGKYFFCKILNLCHIQCIIHNDQIDCVVRSKRERNNAGFLKHQGSFSMDQLILIPHPVNYVVN